MNAMARATELAATGFDCISALKRSENMHGLTGAAGSMFAQLGLPSFALARFFARDLSPAVTVLAGEFHKEWSERYVANRYADFSQIAREMTTNPAPYSWDDVMCKQQVTPGQKRIRDEARVMGLANGLFTPISWPDGSYVAIALAGPGGDLADPLVRTWAEIISAYFACESRRLLAEPGRAQVALSPRQRECLAWVRHGKSSNVIGEILGLSVQTVDEHVAQACRKLGVRTRIQAAVEASLAGLID